MWKQNCAGYSHLHKEPQHQFPHRNWVLEAVLAKRCWCTPSLSFLTLVDSCVYKQNAVYTKCSMYKPSCWPQCITLCNVGMAERDNVRESNSLSLLQRQACPQPHAHINLSLLFMGSFHKPVQLAHPTKRVLIVLFWVSKVSQWKNVMKLTVSVKNGAGPHSQLQKQEKG